MICDADPPMWWKTASRCHTATEQTAESLPAETIQTHTCSLTHQQNKHLSLSEQCFSFSVSVSCPLSVISPYCSNSRRCADIWRPCRVLPSQCAAAGLPVNLQLLHLSVFTWMLCKISSMFHSLFCASVFYWSQYCYTLFFLVFLIPFCISFVLVLLFRLLDGKHAGFYCTLQVNKMLTNENIRSPL